MEFIIGERVVYPNHGVGIVEEVTRRYIFGQPEEFILLRIQSTNSLVLVPTSNVESVGLRKVITKSDVSQLFRLLKGGFREPPNDWKDRYKENCEKMRSGSIYQVAEVLKNLVYLSFRKSLSFREKRMLEKARQLVVGEIAIVRNQTEDRVENLIDKALGISHHRTGGSA